MTIVRRAVAKLRSQDWAAVIVELIVVVLGVFIGLQANNWNEDREAKVRRAQIVATLIADLRDARQNESISVDLGTNVGNLTFYDADSLRKNLRAIVREKP